MLKKIFLVLALQVILINAMNNADSEEQINLMFYTSLKPVLSNDKITNKEKYDYMYSLFEPLYTRKLEQEKERERQLKQREALEKAIYQKYLANRVKGSSILQDFQSMRFY